MSRKRFNPLEDPPTASSSDEEDEVETTSLGDGERIEESSSSEDVESSRDSALKKPESAHPSPEKQQVSDSESGSDEETDSDSETQKKVLVKKNPESCVVKSVKVPKDSVGEKNLDSEKVKPSAKSVTKKRPVSETDGAEASKDAKRAKSGGGEETKKTYFQRVWSEEDEIAALQGLIDYKKETGVSPYDDTNAYYQFVKKAISFDVSKIQVIKKLRGLRKKYESNVGKGKNGEEPTFSKPHDRKAFELSKFAWGADGMALESAVKSNGKLKKSLKSSKIVEPVKKPELIVSSSPNGKSSEDDVANKGEASSVPELDAFVKSVLVKSLARFGVDDLSAQQGWSRLAPEDKKRFEEQWKVLQLREFEFYSQKSGFIHEVVTKMAESFRPDP